MYIYIHMYYIYNYICTHTAIYFFRLYGYIIIIIVLYASIYLSIYLTKYLSICLSEWNLPTHSIERDY